VEAFTSALPTRIDDLLCHLRNTTTAPVR